MKSRVVAHELAGKRDGLGLQAAITQDLALARWALLVGRREERRVVARELCLSRAAQLDRVAGLGRAVAEHAAGTLLAAGLVALAVRADRLLVLGPAERSGGGELGVQRLLVLLLALEGLRALLGREVGRLLALSHARSLPRGELLAAGLDALGLLDAALINAQRLLLCQLLDDLRRELVDHVGVLG